MKAIKEQIKNLESLLECATFAEDTETIWYCENEIERLNKKLKKVSVPSRGLSYLNKQKEKGNKEMKKLFPSPHGDSLI